MKNVCAKTYPAPLSGVCLGTASMGSNGLTGEPVEQAFAVLDVYYALGGRFLDTANVYGRWGRDHTNASEKVIGRWLAARGYTDVTVTTKACHYLPEAHDVSRVDGASMAVDVEESRAALGLDTLDILLLHRDNEAVDIRTIVDFCVPYVEKGLVKRFGFSNFRTARVKTAIDYLGTEWQKYFAGVSNEWSLAMEGAVDYSAPDGMVATDHALRELQKEHGFLIFPFSSIAHGFFDKLHRCGAVYENGVWAGTEGFTGNRSWLTAANGEAYNRLLLQSEETGRSLTMLSLRYLTEQYNAIPIMSVSRAEQLRELGEIL